MDQWIKVNQDYTGIDTNGMTVRKGTYPEGAPELFGAAGQSLVDDGIAEWVDAPVVEVAGEDVTLAEVTELDKEVADGSVELSSLTNAELRAMLEEDGKDTSAAKTKADLLALFENSN